MKSNMAKVLHEILDVPMIVYVLRSAYKIAKEDVIVVVGHQADEVKNVCMKVHPAKFVYQKEQLGTGHAVQCALPSLSASAENIIILCGDVPLISIQTIQALLEDHMKERRSVSLLAVKTDNPTGYGRVVMNNQRELKRIIEEADANEDEKSIKLINSGIYCVERGFLFESLEKIRPDNAQGEFYLTDIIELAYEAKKKIGVLVGKDPEEVAGINTISELKAVEKEMKRRKRDRL
jgi:bifunctional UDP-N-acetylglucosamine pyrophosphorylase/glucosamine-1-phosphate N-acetyltransferase/UDP-N-acetylglucosamine pyrophosphorylase